MQASIVWIGVRICAGRSVMSVPTATSENTHEFGSVSEPDAVLCKKRASREKTLQGHSRTEKVMRTNCAAQRVTLPLISCWF